VDNFFDYTVNPMKKRTLYSWNVNGLRAVHKKGFLEWMQKAQPDIVCLQEIKSHREQLPESLQEIKGYSSHFCSAQRKGYSGVAIYSKEQPFSLQCGFGIERFDEEGRVLIAEYEKFVVYNVYVPNGGRDFGRLQYKYDFYAAFLKQLKNDRKKGKRIIVCGDINTAHQEIDLARPKENVKHTGFLPEERIWIDRYLQAGFVDTFRDRYPNKKDQYSWWDVKTRARERNVGWRLDYVFVSKNLQKQVTQACIEQDVSGSDHCPVGITFII